MPARIFVPSICSPARRRRALRECAAASQIFAAQGAQPIHAFDQTETLLGIQERIRKLVLVETKKP